jgi:hypothetical protein
MTETDITTEMSTDQAFVSAITPKKLNGIKLEPYSLMRQVVAMELNVPNSSKFFDAVMRIWVCTMSEDEALDLRNWRPEDEENPLPNDWRKEAQKKAFQWAEAQGYSMLNYKPLLDLYDQLDRELAASGSARLKDPGDAPPKNSGGPQT